jgi:hypothetical protein
MTPTPDLPQYLVDAAERFDAASEEDHPGEYREAFDALEQAMRQAHVDIYTIIDDTTEMKEAA